MFAANPELPQFTWVCIQPEFVPWVRLSTLSPEDPRARFEYDPWDWVLMFVVEVGVVDVATEDDEGSWERTFIVLPVGAATELEGPGGDGFITVITPASPVSKALMGRRVGDLVDVTIRREPFEWEILAVA